MSDVDDTTGQPPLGAVGFVHTYDFAYVLAQVGRRLREIGFNVYFYTGSEQSAKQVGKDPAFDFADDVIAAGVLREAVVAPVPNHDMVVARARRFEARIGETYNQLLMARRDISNGFALSGFRHPETFLVAGTKYVNIVNAFNAELSFWENEIVRRSIVHFINPYKHLAVLCRAMQVGVSILSLARHKGYFFWANSEYCDNEGLEQAYEAVGDAPPPENVKQESYSQDIGHRNEFYRNLRWDRLTRSLASYAIAHVKRRLAVGREGYRFWSNVRYLVRRNLESRRMMGRGFHTLADIKEAPLLYFPLQSDPEWTLQVQTPEYFCQLWAIASVARDLPAGATLLIKEHIYGIGRRPRDFIDQIAALKNVKLLKLSENALDVIRRVDAVVTINGTGGYEAAMLGKPSVFLSKRCDLAFLPHVVHAPMGQGLREALDRALALASGDRSFAREGYRLLRAIEASCFDLAQYSSLDRKNVDPAGAVAATNSILEEITKCRQQALQEV